MSTRTDSPTFRILAVDDEEGLLSLIRDTLTLPEDTPTTLEAVIAGDQCPLPTSPAFAFAGCTSGDQGLTLVRESLKHEEPFAVALIDVRLGAGLNGIETAAAIRQLDPDVEIVMITGQGRIDLCELNRRIPPPSKLLYLEKPFKPQELRQLAISLTSKWHSEKMLQEMTRTLTLTVEERLARTRELEQQLRQSQKMEALGTLAGGIAHDFNNILGVILGYAEIIRETSGTDESLVRRVDEILTAGGRARDLIGQILNFSRQGPQEIRPLNLSPLLTEALKLLHASAPDQVEILTEIHTENDQVAADPTQIHQILLNLCTNAIHAMGETGGTLRVCLGDVPTDQAQPAGMDGTDWFVRLSVTDTGPGMEPEVMERIFDPFFTTKRTGEGTGLGLSVVHGIVKNHGGIIEVVSEPGQGTTFHVYLPRVDSELALEPLEESVLLPGQGRVLFVDDELPLAEIGREMLQGFGFEVVVRTSSIEALEAFRFRPGDFDLVVTDHFMPNMNGLDLAREMLDIRPGMPIILCTGFSDALSYKRIRSLGISSMIKKPILKSKLIAAVGRLLEPTGE